MALKVSNMPKGDDAKPVVIAGAGPVGSVLALYLAQQGIRVVLIEKADELPCDLRASTFHPPTLDMLDELDLTASLISQGLIVREFQFRERATGEAVNFNLARISDSTNHPYRLQCEQYCLSRALSSLAPMARAAACVRPLARNSKA